MAESTEQPVSTVEEEHTSEEQHSAGAGAERSGEGLRLRAGSLPVHSSGPSSQPPRSAEEEELDGFPVFGADEEDWDMDSNSSQKSRRSDEREENESQNESVTTRGTNTDDNARCSQMGDSTTQSEASQTSSQGAGEGYREDSVTKIKDEPIDEGYDKALMPQSDISRVKQELENGDNESAPPTDELRISSVFSVRGNSEPISAPVASSQPPPFSASAIKMLPVVLPGQLQPQLQAKSLTQPTPLLHSGLQLQPGFHLQPQAQIQAGLQPQLQLQPGLQIQPQPQLQPQPPPATIRICCSGCSKVLQKGQTAFQRKGSNQLFCSTVCLTGFNVPPTISIVTKKTCHLCLKVIGNLKDLITVPVDSSNTLKEFCSQACLNIYKRSRIESIREGDRVVRCAVCRHANTIQHEVNHQGLLHRICSDECFSRFRSSKRLSMSCCENCGNCTVTGNYHLVQIEDAVKKFCSPVCINTFKQKGGVRVHCPCCQDFKSVDQMIAGTNTQGVIEFFCSARCVNNSQASRTLSGASFPCTNCQKLAVPQYHLAMSDGSIRNFCTYDCTAKFQERLQRSAPATQVNGSSTTAPNVSSHIPQYTIATRQPGAYPVTQVYSSTSSITSLNPLPNSNQNPTPPNVPALGPANPQDNKQQRASAALTVSGSQKLTCKQCHKQFGSKPEVLQFRNHVGVFCSRVCCDTYKREKDVKAVCEYCKQEKVVKDVIIYEQQPRPFCCEGCKLLFKHDLTKRHGGQCRICAYCSNMTHSTIQNHFGGKLEEFCTEECMSLNTVMFYEMAKCHGCKSQGTLKENLRWDGKIRHFCNLQCLLQFCSKNVLPDQPSRNGITPAAAPAAQAPLSLSKHIPVIGGVVSLSSALTANTAITGALPTSDASSKNIGDASTQTDAAVHAAPYQRRMLKNKALMCKPIIEEQAIQCELEPPQPLFETVIDENGEKVRLVPLPVPVPIPIYIPVPMHLYTQYTPVPMGLPLPVPVPVPLPSSQDSANIVSKGSVPSQSSVDEDDVEKGKSRPVSHGDQGSTYSGDLESEARSTPFSWADGEDSTHSHKPSVNSSVSEGPTDAPTTSSSVLDLEKDYPLATNDHAPANEQKASTKRRRRAKRDVTVELMDGKLNTEDSEQSDLDTGLNVGSCENDEETPEMDISSGSEVMTSDEEQVDPLEPQTSFNSHSQLDSQPRPSSKTELQKNGKKSSTDKWCTKQQFCVYCKKPNTKMARHLQHKHAKETEVANALSFPKGSKRRRLLFDQLLKKGNYQHNIEVLQNGNGIPVFKIQPRTKKSINEYLPCQYCLAFYLKSSLLKHERFCKTNSSSEPLQQPESEDWQQNSTDASVLNSNELNSQPLAELSLAQLQTPSLSAEPTPKPNLITTIPEAILQPGSEPPFLLSAQSSLEILKPLTSESCNQNSLRPNGGPESSPPTLESVSLEKCHSSQSPSPDSSLEQSLQPNLKSCHDGIESSTDPRPGVCQKTSIEPVDEVSPCPDLLQQSDSSLSPGSCLQPNLRSSLNQSPQQNVESLYTATKRCSSETSTGLRPEGCQLTSLGLISEPSSLPSGFDPKTLLSQESDSSHPPSPGSCHQHSLRSSPEQSLQPSLESYKTTERSSPERSPGPRSESCNKTSCCLLAEPSPLPSEPSPDIFLPRESDSAQPFSPDSWHQSSLRSSPEQSIQPSPDSSCKATERSSPERSPGPRLGSCHKTSLCIIAEPSSLPSEPSPQIPLHQESDSSQPPSPGLQLSPEQTPQHSLELCSKAMRRSSRESSPDPRTGGCDKTTLGISPEPNLSISQPCHESLLPQKSESDQPLNQADSESNFSNLWPPRSLEPFPQLSFMSSPEPSPHPGFNSCLPASEEYSPGLHPLSTPECCPYTEFESSPQPSSESSNKFSSESSAEPSQVLNAESTHQPIMTDSSSPQPNLTSCSKYNLRSKLQTSDKPKFDNNGTMDSDVSDCDSEGSNYDPLDDKQSFSTDSDDGSDNPVEKTLRTESLTKQIDVGSSNGSSCQNNSSQSTTEQNSSESLPRLRSGLQPRSDSFVVPSKPMSINTATKMVGGLIKKNFCVFCKKHCTKMARHLMRTHAEEPDVALARSFRKGSKKRRLLFEQLLKKGNYLHNVEVLKSGSGVLVTHKRPSEDYSVSEYLPCQHCLAFYMRHELWRHERRCKMKKDDDSGCRKRVQSASTKLLPLKGYVSGACEELFRGMNQDNILDHMREDALICKYGDILFVKYGHDKKQRGYVTQKLKELGRFMMAVKELDEDVRYLHQICTPARFNLAIEGAKKVCGFDESSNKFETPSLPLKIAYSLRQAAEIFYGENFMKNNAETASQVKEFLELLETNWIYCAESSLLNESESTDLERHLDSTVAALSSDKHSESDIAPEENISQCKTKHSLLPNLTISLQPSPESNLKASVMPESVPSPCREENGVNVDINELNLIKDNSSGSEHQTEKFKKFFCRTKAKEPSKSTSAPPSRSRQKSTKKIKVNLEFSSLPCPRAKPRDSSIPKAVPSRSRPVKSCRPTAPRSVKDGRLFCFYCQKPVNKLARHLAIVHAKEEEVAQALSFPKQSKSRRKLLKKICNKGTYQHNLEVLQKGVGEIIPVKRSKKLQNKYEFCPDCLGFFMQTDLWRHQQTCSLRKNNENGPLTRKRRYRSLEKKYTFSDCLSEGCQEIVRHMRDDDISKHLRTDALICKFGNKLYEKYKHDKELNSYISQKMRELGRFTLAVKEMDNTVASLQDVCTESKFNLALEAAKKISHFDCHTNKFKTSTVPLKLSYSLKQCTEIALKENGMGDEASAQARKFIELLETDFVSYVSSHSSKNTSKHVMPDFLTLTEDVIKLHDFLKNADEQAKKDLAENPNGNPWKQLRDVLLAEISLFNRGRKGVTDRMLLENSLQRAKGPFERNIADPITKIEECIGEALFRIEVPCGDINVSAVLTTERMASSLDILNKHREDVGVPEDNPYVFARLGATTHPRASDCIRTFARICGANNPEYLTSLNTHKNVATVFQILSLTGSELHCLEKLVGDYSFDQILKENPLELAKFCKMLHKVEQGVLLCGANSCDESNLDLHSDHSKQITDAGPVRVATSKDKRKKWSEREQQAVRRQMGKFISHMKVPGKKDCLVCLKAEPEALESRTWQDVKNFIHNTIQSNKKRKISSQIEEIEDEVESDEDVDEAVDSDAASDEPCQKRRYLLRSRRCLVTEESSSAVPAPSSSKLHRMYGVQAWASWVQWRAQQSDVSPLTVNEDVLQCSSEELSKGLCHFISEVRRPNGQAYAPDSVYYLCLGIQQFLLKNERLENIFMDPLYSQFTLDITKLLRDWEHDLPPSGFLQSRVEESFMWECKQLGALSPIVLLNTLLYFVVKFLNLKTLDQHRALSFSNVTCCSRNAKLGTPACLRFRFTEKDEDTQVLPGKRKREKDEENMEYREIPENTENPLHCPVKLYEFYLSKCSESVKLHPHLFYLQPDSSCSPNSTVWFSAQPVESALLESMLMRALAVRDVHLDTKQQEETASSGEESS